MKSEISIFHTWTEQTTFSSSDPNVFSWCLAIYDITRLIKGPAASTIFCHYVLQWKETRFTGESLSFWLAVRKVHPREIFKVPLFICRLYIWPTTVPRQLFKLSSDVDYEPLWPVYGKVFHWTFPSQSSLLPTLKTFPFALWTGPVSWQLVGLIGRRIASQIGSTVYNFFSVSGQEV